MSALSDAMQKAKAVEILLDLDFRGLPRRYASREIAVPDSTGPDRLFRACFLKVPEIWQTFDFRTMTYSSRSVAVEITNKERLQDDEVGRTLDGCTGNIYAWAPGLEWADIERDGLLFSGLFQKNDHDKYSYRFSLDDPWEPRSVLIPATTINAATWPNMRTAGGGGSVAQKPEPLLFGKWPKGIPLRCVDTAAYKYLAQAGVSKNLHTDYSGGAYAVYNKSGGVIAASNYTFYPSGLDAQGNVCAYFDFTADQSANEPLSCSIRGLYDASGEITGTADGLIEHPADILTYLIARHTIFTETGTDKESFKTMRTILASAKFAVLINDQVPAVDAINRIAGQCLCAPLIRAGKAAVMTLDTTIPPRGKIAASNEIVGRTAKITQTPKDDICNKVRLRYALNPTTGQFEAELIRDRTSSNVAKRSYLDYGEAEKTFDCPDVQDQIVAYQLADRLLEIKAYRHDMAEIELPYWEGIDWREGDVAELTLEEGPSRTGQGWIGERCVLIERSFKRHTIVQKWLHI
jgi:hypothetical protein